MILAWLIEAFFGKWECVVAHPIIENGWVIVCRKHSVTKRIDGHVLMPEGKIYQLEHHVAVEHYMKYGTP